MGLSREPSFLEVFACGSTLNLAAPLLFTHRHHLLFARLEHRR